MNFEVPGITMHSVSRRQPENKIPFSFNKENFRQTFLSNSLRNLQLSIMPNLLVSGVIIDLFCYIYPAYCSLKAVKNNNGSEIIQWISYWILASAFVLIERTIIFSTIEPLFSILRRSVCIWCLLPIPNNGATIIYHNVLYRIMNNESPGRVIRDISRNISLDRMQRKAQELRDTVAEKIRVGRSEVANLARSDVAEAQNRSRPEVSVSPEMGETSHQSSPGPMLPRIIDYSLLDPIDDSGR